MPECLEDGCYNGFYSEKDENGIIICKSCMYNLVARCNSETDIT